MTIYEDHEEAVSKLKNRHRKELDALDVLLKEHQGGCPHKWKRYDDLFYALGETYPGERCEKCGAQRKLQ